MLMVICIFGCYSLHVYADQGPKFLGAHVLGGFYFSGAQAMVALATLHQINTEPLALMSTPSGRV